MDKTQKLEAELTGEQQKNTIFQRQMSFPIVFSAVIVLLLAWHILICCDYPYYFIWDMDHITCLDMVLIQSGLLPDQINHPGSGMYLLLFFSEKIAHFLGIISALDLAEVAGSLNPLAVMAELTNFVRLHSPFLSVGVAILLCIATQVIFGMSRWWALFFLVFLGVQESLVYHSSMVRSELYSVFYWGGAVLTMAAAAKAGRPVKRYVGLLATGVLLGLCFLTKIQSLFYLAAAPVLLLLMFSFFGDSPKEGRRKLASKGVFWVLALSMFNVAAFPVLGIASYSTAIPQGAPTWAAAFRVTPVAAMFFLALLLLFLCQLYLCLTNKASSDIFRLFSFFSVIVAGFILSFGLFFLLYSDAALSLQYILLNFKIAFLRVLLPTVRISPADYIPDFLLYVRYNPTLFIVHLALTSLLVFGYLRGFVRITKYQVALCLVATSVAFVNVAVATRPILRDILWREVLVNFLNLFYFAILASRATRYHLTLTRIGGGLLILLLVVNFAHTCAMPERIDANYTQYGWQTNKFFDAVYGGNQQKYSKIMREKYNNTTAWVAIAKAVDHRQIRRTVDFVFKNEAITHRNIGIVFEGFSAWSADLDYKITEVPPAMRAAILVDNASVEPKSKTFFKEEYVRENSEYMDKFKKSSTGRRISVLTRPDLKIFLFVEAGDVSGLVSNQIAQTQYKIVVQNTKQTIELQGLEIKNYCEIPLDKFSRKFFFVICKI
ncbi:MAG: hypothetical protein WAK60_05690 [Sedimentisphaerales bacterium]